MFADGRDKNCDVERWYTIWQSAADWEWRLEARSSDC